MTFKLLTEHHLEFLSLKGGCTGLSESTLVKMLHCWKSHVAAQMIDQRATYTWKSSNQYILVINTSTLHTEGSDEVLLKSGQLLLRIYIDKMFCQRAITQPIII